MIREEPPPLFQTFDGETFDPKKDANRLGEQLFKVLSLMADGEWRTPAELEKHLGVNWASISARLRDLRKPRFGGHQVERERVGGRGGTFRYRVLVRWRSNA